MADISKITLPNGNTYNLKDPNITAARIKSVLANASSSSDGLMSAADKSKLDSMTTVPLASGINMTEGTDGLIFTYVS